MRPTTGTPITTSNPREKARLALLRAIGLTQRAGLPIRGLAAEMVKLFGEIPLGLACALLVQENAEIPGSVGDELDEDSGAEWTPETDDEEEEA